MNFISDSKFFLFQLVFDNLTRKIKLIVNQNEEKSKEKKFLNKKRHNSKHMNKLVFFEDSFDEISQFFEWSMIYIKKELVSFFALFIKLD